MQEITKQNFLEIGSGTETDILKICKNISNDDLLINIKRVDIFYVYKFKNNKITKLEETVIFISTIDIEKKISDSYIKNFFFDVTYKIFPKDEKNNY